MPTAWVDQNTRCIFHDFTLFNPSTTVAVRVRMVIEVLPAGSMHTSVSLDVIDGFDMRIKFSLVAVVIEILFWLIAAKFVWDELFSFLSIWNRPGSNWHTTSAIVVKRTSERSQRFAPARIVPGSANIIAVRVVTPPPPPLSQTHLAFTPGKNFDSWCLCIS